MCIMRQVYDKFDGLVNYERESYKLSLLPLMVIALNVHDASGFTTNLNNLIS